MVPEAGIEPARLSARDFKSVLRASDAAVLAIFCGLGGTILKKKGSKGVTKRGYTYERYDGAD